jgi:hypothetical protein
MSSAAEFAGLQEGALVLADISGYSSFVQQTEVDHSWSILHELLDTMVRSVAGRMDVSQVEGDAILFISGLSTEDVVKALQETFVAFHRRQRDMQTVTTCPATLAPTSASSGSSSSSITADSRGSDSATSSSSMAQT